MLDCCFYKRAGRKSSDLHIHLSIYYYRLNPHCNTVVHDLVLDSSNAQPIIDSYDIVVDATDNVATRYLLNDACVLGGKPLVSGSALRLDGQLTIYNYRGGPCYRCLFPTPPPAETVTNCSDGGVLGVGKEIGPRLSQDCRDKSLAS